MYEIIIGKLKELNYRIITINIDNEELKFLYTKNRILFIYHIKESIDELNKICNDINRYLISGYSEIKKYFTTEDEKSPLSDLNDKIPSIKAFLWDLYIIGIVDNEAINITDEQYFMIQRDTYIAKKVVIKDENEKTLEKVIDVIEPEKKFMEMLKNENKQFSEKTIIDFIKTGKGLDLKSQYKEIIDITGWNRVKDISDYIDSIKDNLE